MTRFWQRVANIFSGRKPTAGKDLRSGMARVVVPDEHEHLAGGVSPSDDSGPDIVAPNFHIQAPGDTVKG